MIPIEVGGNEPSAAELAALIRQAKAENIEVIFAQPQFSTDSAQTIANEIGGEVILIDPLAEDWLSNMRKVADTFEQVLS
jgi:zinc transport system substrate-binding protein